MLPTVTTVTVRAPLKLVIAGEYAVLEAGVPGIAAAIDRYVTCSAEPAKEVSLATVGPGESRLEGGRPDAAGEVDLAPVAAARDDLRFARIALKIGYRYLGELGLDLTGVRLACDSRAGMLEREDAPPVKLGLGTSAAATVSILGALLAVHGLPLDRPTFVRNLFRLALLAHEEAQGELGSGIDIAAAVFGGLIEYTRPDPRTAKQRRLLSPTPLAAVRGAWPGLHVEPLPIPTSMRLLAGFTGKPASTRDLVHAVERWKRDHADEYAHFVKESRRAVEALGSSLRQGHAPGVLAAIHKARRSLALLGERAKVPIETPELERLISVAEAADARAKPSGAGGGDCGIAVAFDPATAERVLVGWLGAGILPVPVEVARWGVHEALKT
jgi:ERG8-type phosphomevalonate kinase